MGVHSDWEAHWQLRTPDQFMLTFFLTLYVGFLFCSFHLASLSSPIFAVSFFVLIIVQGDLFS